MEDIIAGLRGLPHGRPVTNAPGARAARLPDDFVAQLFPSSDVPHIPTDSLVRVETVTHRAGGDGPLRTDSITPGSPILVAPPAVGADAHGQSLPIVVGVAVETSNIRGKILVVWYVPELAAVENDRGGKKKMVLGVFGPWRSTDAMRLADLREHRLPEPLVSLESILEANFEFDSDGALPYDVFDSLRTRHGIDLTGFNTSMTQRGNLYRSCVLMRGV